MSETPTRDTAERINELEATVRLLQRKLRRAEVNRKLIEEAKDCSYAISERVIGDLK